MTNTTEPQEITDAKKQLAILKVQLESVPQNETTKQAIAKITSSITELDKTSTPDRAAQAQSIADTATAMINGFQQITSGDPVTSIMGALGMIGSLASLASGPAGIIVGAISSVIGSILSLFGLGVGGESELQKQEKMIRRLLEDFGESNINALINGVTVETNNEVRTLETLIKKEEVRLESVTEHIEKSLAFLKKAVLLGRIAYYINENLGESDETKASRANRYLIAYVMVYTRKKMALTYFLNIAREYKNIAKKGEDIERKLQTQVDFYESAIDNLTNNAKEVIQFVQSPAEIQDRETYKQFFLQPKPSRDLVINLQKKLLAPEKRMNGNLMTLRNLEEPSRVLFGYNNDKVQASSILQPSWNNIAQLYQAEPERQFWQVLEVPNSTEKAIYNIYTKGYLEVEGQKAILNTSSSFTPAVSAIFEISKSPLDKSGVSGYYFVVKNKATGAYLNLKKPNPNISSNLNQAFFVANTPQKWLEAPATKKFIRLKSVSNDKYVALDKGGFFLDAWVEVDQATEFEVLTQPDKEGKDCVSLKIGNEYAQWFSYQRGGGERIKKYGYPADGNDTVYWIIEKAGEKDQYVTLMDNYYNYYVGAGDNGALHLTKANQPNQESCYFIIEEV